MHISRCCVLQFALSCLLLATTASAQTGEPHKLTAEQQWRIEVLLRSAMELPPETSLSMHLAGPSTIPGFDKLSVTSTLLDKTSNSFDLLLSQDGNTVAQYKEFRISPGTQKTIRDDSRPGRGGGSNAPIQMVLFDDLECPYCADLNARLYPSLQQRYGKLIHISYRDFPLEGHPWAIHAAIAAGCLQNAPTAYWNAIDKIHSQSAVIDKPGRDLDKAIQQIDGIVHAEAAAAGLADDAVSSCLRTSDRSSIDRSLQQGQALGVHFVPTLFVNGARISGAISNEFLFTLIDRALLAQGIPVPSSSVNEK